MLLTLIESALNEANDVGSSLEPLVQRIGALSRLSGEGLIAAAEGLLHESWRIGVAPTMNLRTIESTLVALRPMIKISEDDYI